MPLQLAIGNHSGVVSEHLLFEGIAYRLGKSPQADIEIEQTSSLAFEATLHASATDGQWRIYYPKQTDTTCKVTQQGTLLNIDNETIKLGDMNGRLVTLTLEEMAKIDSLYFWRRQQLRRHQSDLNSTFDLHGMFCVAWYFLKRTMHCDNAAIVLTNPTDETVIPFGFGKSGKRASVSCCLSLIQQCAENHSIQALGCFTNNSEKLSSLTCAICVPILVEGILVGFFYGDNEYRRRYFSQSDARLIQTMANQLADRWLFQQLEKNTILAESAF